MTGPTGAAGASSGAMVIFSSPPIGAGSLLATSFVQPAGGGIPLSINERKVMFPRNTTITKMEVYIDGSPSATFSFTARKNGVDTVLGAAAVGGPPPHNVTGGGLSVTFLANTDTLSVRMDCGGDLSKNVNGLSVVFSE